MRKSLFAALLSLCAFAGNAQEKVMNIVKTDGTRIQTRVEELKQISFLTVSEGGEGLVVKTIGGGTASILFEESPVVTIQKGKLTIKPKTTDAVEFEITDIEEIVFGKKDDETTINKLEGFGFILQNGGALLKGIPEGTEPRIYTIDGRTVPTPPLHNGELRLSRNTLGTGIFIVKVGTFSTKIKF